MTPYWKARSLGVCVYPSCFRPAIGCHCETHAERANGYYRAEPDPRAEAAKRSIDVLCKQIRARRLSLGMTQGDVAKAAGLTRNYIGLVENGQRSLSEVAAARVAKALGCRLKLVPVKERSRA